MATVTKGDDLDYAWRAVGEAYSARGLSGGRGGGEPRGTWWGPGAERLNDRRGPRGEAVAIRNTILAALAEDASAGEIEAAIEQASAAASPAPSRCCSEPHPGRGVSWSS